LAAYLTILSLTLVARLLMHGSLPRLRSLFVLASGFTAVLCLVLIASPEPLARATSFFDATVMRKLNSSSGVDRAAANQLAWSDFLATYGLGVGLGSTRASSFALVLLSNLGILGAVGFVGFFVNVLRSPATDDSSESVTARAARQAVLAGLIGACVVGTVFDLGIAFYCFAAAATVTRRDIALAESAVLDAGRLGELGVSMKRGSPNPV
jgi:hypothetical protein